LSLFCFICWLFCFVCWHRGTVWRAKKRHSSLLFWNFEGFACPQRSLIAGSVVRFPIFSVLVNRWLLFNESLVFLTKCLVGTLVWSNDRSSRMEEMSSVGTQISDYLITSMTSKLVIEGIKYPNSVFYHKQRKGFIGLA
jgi:hypothetical protein